jgi:hypothetical protein
VKVKYTHVPGLAGIGVIVPEEEVYWGNWCNNLENSKVEGKRFVDDMRKSS